MVYHIIFGLSLFTIACQSPPEKINRSYKMDFAVTTTTSVEFTAGSTIAWGGLVMFRAIRMEATNEYRVALSITDPKGIVIRVSEITPHIVCTMNIPKCMWTFPTKGWKTSDGETPRFISIIFRPDGEKLEDADVKIYADGIHRLATLLVWESPPTSDGINLIADAIWKNNSS